MQNFLNKSAFFSCFVMLFFKDSRASSCLQKLLTYYVVCLTTHFFEIGKCCSGRQFFYQNGVPDICKEINCTLLVVCATGRRIKERMDNNQSRKETCSVSEIKLDVRKDRSMGFRKEKTASQYFVRDMQVISEFKLTYSRSCQ